MMNGQATGEDRDRRSNCGALPSSRLRRSSAHLLRRARLPFSPDRGALAVAGMGVSIAVMQVSPERTRVATLAQVAGSPRVPH